jgi:hypothetical protein
MPNVECRMPHAELAFGVRHFPSESQPSATDPTRLTDFVTPTSGAIVAVTAAVGVKFGDWLAFAFRLYLLLLVFAALAIAAVSAVHL